MQLLQVPRMSSATLPLSVTVPPTDDQYYVGGNHGGDHGTQSIKRTSVSGKLITPLWRKCGSRRSPISYRLPRSAQNRTQERVLVSMWLLRNLRWIVDTILTLCLLVAFITRVQRPQNRHSQCSLQLSCIFPHHSPRFCTITGPRTQRLIAMKTSVRPYANWKRLRRISGPWGMKSPYLHMHVHDCLYVL